MEEMHESRVKRKEKYTQKNYKEKFLESLLKWKWTWICYKLLKTAREGLRTALSLKLEKSHIKIISRNKRDNLYNLQHVWMICANMGVGDGSEGMGFEKCKYVTQVCYFYIQFKRTMLHLFYRRKNTNMKCRHDWMHWK